MSDKLIFTEIYGGKDPKWKGWHNVSLKNGNPEEDICIVGPLDPARSARLIAATKPTLPSDEEIRQHVLSFQGPEEYLSSQVISQDMRMIKVALIYFAGMADKRGGA